MGDFRNENEYPPLFISDALSQNILCHAYREPKTVEQLSILTGVPAVYIEDRVGNLVKREAVIQPTKATIQTSFLIFDEITSDYGDDIIDDIISTVSDGFYEAAHQLTEETIALGIQTAGRSVGEIMCFLSAMLLNAIVPDSMPEHLPGKFGHFPRRYDGYRWKYIGFKEGTNGSGSRVSMGAERSMNNLEHGKMAHYHFHFEPFTYRKFLFDYEIDVCQAVLQGAALNDKQAEVAAELIAKGYLEKNSDGQTVCTIPVFTKEQRDLFAKAARAVFADFLPVYAAKIKQYVDGHVKLFPKHLKEDALFNGFNIFSAMFKAIAKDWVARGKVIIPDGAVCDGFFKM